MTHVRIALIGDHNPAVLAHQAIPVALDLAATQRGVAVAPTWVATETIGAAGTAQLDAFDGVWCVPASPYRSTTGALAAIRVARETGRPFLGTCGGFQHALLEYAHNVLGLRDAAHAETDPDAPFALVAPWPVRWLNRPTRSPSRRVRAWPRSTVRPRHTRATTAATGSMGTTHRCSLTGHSR